MDRWVGSLLSLNALPSSSIDRIKDHAAAVVSDGEFIKRAERWPENTPDTKEACFIRQTFDGEAFDFLLSRALIAENPPQTFFPARARPKQLSGELLFIDLNHSY